MSYVCVGMYACAMVRMWSSENNFQSQVSASTMQILGTKPGSLGVVAAKQALYCLRHRPCERPFNSQHLMCHFPKPLPSHPCSRSLTPSRPPLAFLLQGSSGFCCPTERQTLEQWFSNVVMTHTGVTYQLSCISDIYIMIHNSSKVTYMK